MKSLLLTAALIFFILLEEGHSAPQNKSLILLLDLRRESDCNHIENYVPQTEVNEIARQRAEAVQWALQRLQEQEETTSSEEAFGKIVTPSFLQTNELNPFKNSIPSKTY